MRPRATIRPPSDHRANGPLLGLLLVLLASAALLVLAPNRRSSGRAPLARQPRSAKGSASRGSHPAGRRASEPQQFHAPGGTSPLDAGPSPSPSPLSSPAQAAKLGLNSSQALCVQLEDGRPVVVPVAGLIEALRDPTRLRQRRPAPIARLAPSAPAAPKTPAAPATRAGPPPVVVEPVQTAAGAPQETLSPGGTLPGGTLPGGTLPGEDDLPGSSPAQAAGHSGSLAMGPLAKSSPPSGPPASAAPAWPISPMNIGPPPLTPAPATPLPPPGVPPKSQPPLILPDSTQPLEPLPPPRLPMAQSQNLLPSAPSDFGNTFNNKFGQANAPVARPYGSQADAEPSLLRFENADVREVLQMFASAHNLNIMVASEVQGQVTGNLEGLEAQEALQAILDSARLVAAQRGKVLHVEPARALADQQPQQPQTALKVFELSYRPADEVLLSISKRLSVYGDAHASQIDPTDNRKTSERITVRDLPANLEAIERDIEVMDQAPRQVMIEAHVMEIELDASERHGVNLQALLFDHFSVNIHGFASPLNSPGVVASFDSSDVHGLLECLRTETNARTLASPRVMVLNGQTANIQVGQKIGYTIVTVNQGVAVEEVKFLDVGVILEVTPTVSVDNVIKMNVKPQVSSGQVDPNTGLPSEETREVMTEVMLPDGKGIVIGGLIQESDSRSVSRVPKLSNVPWIGKIFQRSEKTCDRSEIVVTLVPRIVDLPQGEPMDYEQPNVVVPMDGIGQWTELSDDSRITAAPPPPPASSATQSRRRIHR